MSVARRADRTSPALGRHVFGIAAFALGASQVAGHDFAANWHPVPPGVPFRTALVYVTGVALLAGGAALQWRRTARAGLVVLSVLFALAASLWVRRVVGFPGLIGTWLGFAEQFAPVCAAVVALATLDAPDGPDAPDTRARRRAFAVGRVLFAGCVLTFGAAHFLALQPTVELVPAWIPPGQRFWALATGAGFVLAGVAILTNVRAVLAAGSLTAMFLAFGALLWAPRAFAHPTVHRIWAGNAVNLIAAGASWMVFDALRAARSVHVQAEVRA